MQINIVNHVNTRGYVCYTAHAKIPLTSVAAHGNLRLEVRVVVKKPEKKESAPPAAVDGDARLGSSVTLRLPDELMAALDRRVEELRAVRGPGVYRADVLREALIQFLKAPAP